MSIARSRPGRRTACELAAAERKLRLVCFFFSFGLEPFSKIGEEN